MRKHNVEVLNIMNRILLIILLTLFFLPGIAQRQPVKFASSTFKSGEISSVLTIYPNPCKNKKINVELDNEEISEIKITNITGKEVLLRKMDMPANKVELELNNFPNGIYLLQAKSTQNKMFVKKLLISSN